MGGNHRDRTESDKILLAVPPTTGALHPSLSTSYSTVVPLLARQFCRLQDLGAGHTTAGPVPSTISQLPTATPLVPDAWERALRAHPNQSWVTHLITGIRQGFRIGLQKHPRCRSSPHNAPSAEQQGSVVSDFIATQVKAGCMIGPLPPAQCPGVITSSLAVIPKKSPGRFRVIVNLSAPERYSVNDNLHRDLTHVAYSSVDDAALLLHHLGQQALLAKIDIQDAYRLIPVHPEDHQFFGISWQGGVYIDCQLPFGLASAPAIFCAVAEALEWILRSRGVRFILHYLDDFLLLGPPDSDECAQALRTTLATCVELGVPLAPGKVVGPTTQLTFLGIQLHSTRLLLSLPEDKLNTLRTLLRTWVEAKCIRNTRQFQSLVGHLVHATQVLPLGKAFLNRLFPLARQVSGNAVRRLNTEAKADLAWWITLCQHWSGISTQQFLLLQEPSHHLFTDTSGSWGCGAWSLPSWLQVAWQGLPPLDSIATKELFPIVLACAVWGPQWRGSSILCHCDNIAAVSQVNSLHARDPQQHTSSAVWHIFKPYSTCEYVQYTSQDASMRVQMLYPAIGHIVF